MSNSKEGMTEKKKKEQDEAMITKVKSTRPEGGDECFIRAEDKVHPGSGE
jgi:hypothetical protein